MHIKDDIFQRLVKLHAKILEIADRGFNKLRSSDSSYFHKFEHLIDGKWFSIMPYHNVDLSMVHKQPLSNDDSFDEASSDQCMTNLIGSQQSGIQKQCQITDKCWELMTKKGAEKYYLTHQGLFLILAENRGIVSFISFYLYFIICLSMNFVVNFLFAVHAQGIMHLHVQVSRHVQNSQHEQKIAHTNITVNCAITHAKQEICCCHCNTSEFHLLLL